MNGHQDSFVLPEELCAMQPPEARGGTREDVRLLVIDRASGESFHSQFKLLSQFLKRSDLLVFNRSRTLPAVLTGVDGASGDTVEIRLAEHLIDGTWLALIVGNTTTGSHLKFAGGLRAEVQSQDVRIPKLWRIALNKEHSQLIGILYKFGRPIRYEYVPEHWPIDSYQNVYASEPGSAEMPSAGRAFTWRMLFDLKRRGIKSTSILLHTGLSSYLDDAVDATHPASEEEYEIDESAAEAINKTRMAGGRIIAIGTTVVRALESVADSRGFVRAQHGYTTLKINSAHNLKCANGLITGLHEPQASHLDLLNAFIPQKQLFTAYNEAITERYLWHEFGDLNLII